MVTTPLPSPTSIAAASSALSAIPIAPSACTFPTGMNIDDYPGCESWSNLKWAWEFLRRNKTFQEQCDHIRGWPQRDTPLKRSRQRNTASTFGLKKFKDYIEDFERGQTPNPRFLSEAISFWSRVNEKSYKHQVLPSSLRDGEALVKFDIKSIMKSSKSLDAQLLAAKVALENAFKRYLKQANKKARGTKLKIPPIQLLRAFDANQHRQTAAGSRLTIIDIANVILPQSPNPPLDPAGDMNLRFSRGNEYVGSLYLDLAATKSRPR